MSWPTSAGFKSSLVKSHTPTMKVEILESGVVIASTDVFSLVEDMHVLEGSVDDDYKAAVGRRTADWTIVDKNGVLDPLISTASVYPLRDRDVRLWRGIGAELVPMATVQQARLTVNDDKAGRTFSLSGSDRSVVLNESDWRSELEIADGATPRAATLAILSQVDPSHTYALLDSPTTKTLDGMTFLPGEDPNPWVAIQKIWESAAMEVFFDQMGQLKAQPIPDATTAPISWEFLTGQASIILAPMSIDVDRSTLRNGVIVQGSAPWLLYGVSAEAWDLDVNSTTYYDPSNPGASLVGPRPEYVEDSLVGDEIEAQALADAKLPTVLGIEEQVQFNSIPNPALEAGDVVTIQSDLFSTIPRFVLDQLTTPLTYDGTQSANTRRRNR